ncbi:MAG: hypothetical protein AB1421_13135 [Pseudomonadota bacterium]
MKTRHTLHGAGVLLVALLAGCSSAPPPPDWKMNTVSLLEHYQARWLEGDSRAAELALEKSRAELSLTGRLDLLARLELAACGTRVAALDFSPCTPFVPLAPDAAPADQAYARFITGDWQGMDTKALPPRYAGLAASKDEAAANRAAQDIEDPLGRLIAAGVLVKQGRANPATLAMAVDTASERGWKRPLLTWLEVSRQRAQAAGDAPAVAQIQRRIDLVQGQGRRTP